MKLALSLIFCSGLVFANPRETYKEIIQKAQALSLQQEREQVSQVLKRAIENEKGKKAEQELLKTLSELTTLFYTEKGQSVFEYGRSLFRASPQEALQKFQEALKLEPNNVSILSEIAKIELYTGKCGEATTTVQKALSLNPYSSDLNLLLAQSLSCSQKNDEALLTLKKVNQSVFSFIAFAQIYFSKNEIKQAETHLNLAKIADAKFPEVYYWEMQIRKKSNLNITEQAQLYVKLCKNLQLKDLVKYHSEPRTCLEAKNVEAELKSLLESENKKEL
jgi:predicted Zn-dependent protease